MNRKLPPLKKYKILTILLNLDKEIYTHYESDNMPFKVNFEELVQTLKINPYLYNRPIVELEDYGFLIRGNNIFFKAGVEVGLDSFICDVNINTLNDRHFSQFQLLDVIPEKRPFKLHSVFFIERPYKNFSESSSKDRFVERLNEALRILGYEGNVLFLSNAHNVVELKIKHSLNEEEFVKAKNTAKTILSNYCRIKSENGLVVYTKYNNR